MKKRLSLLLACCLITTMALTPSRAHAAMPPKVKAFLMVSGYGAGSGALLGLASMAFGTSSRAVAQGASLGLYAGILFGTYVLVSHHQRQGSYDDRSSPYKDDADEGDYGDEGGGGFFDSSIPATRGPDLFASADYRGFETKKGGQLPPLQVTLFSAAF